MPFVLLLTIAFLFFVKKRQPKKIQKFFFNAFYLRVAGTFAIAFIYEFVYGYGDTYAYYYITQAISSFFPNNFSSWFEILFSDTTGDKESVKACLQIIEELNPIYAIIFQGSDNVTVCKIASVINTVCFNSYLGIALVFGTLSFLGCWYIFKTFVHIYPGYEKFFLWLCLYLPSLWFWGSGLLKDPLCIFSLGILLYSVFVNKGSLIRRIILIFIGVYFLFLIKPYIIYSFAVAYTGSLIINYFRRINILGKFAAIIIFAGLFAVSFSAVTEAITGGFTDIIAQSETFLNSYTQTAETGDATILPSFDPTPFGFLKLSMQGLVTVYMRPFPWEIRKILYLFLILENLLLYYILFKTVKTGPVTFRHNYRVLTSFCLIFVIFIGVVIGVTSFNLGTIARYRVPALPFLFAGIFAWKLSRRKRKLDKTAISETTVIIQVVPPAVFISKD